MGLRTTMVRGVAAMAAGALPFWVGAHPASAFELYSKQVTLDHTFTDSAGDEVTCSVQYSSALFRPDRNSTFSADTSTQVLVFDPLAGDECDALVSVDVVYRDPQGNARHARAFGTELADLQLDEVQGNYETTHGVFFINCAINCDTTFVTHPK